MLNGGEPVDVNTVSSFLDLLAGHGLRADVMYADWGMTEIASGVVCPDPIAPAEIRNNEFCLGTPIPGTAFRVVDEMDRVIPERDLGRVQVTGSTVTEGYYGNPERTRELFTGDGWLDTGDLGYIANGKLTVTGRAKEVVIINGVNFNCGEIEEIVERIDGVLVSYTAACALRGVDSDTDQLAIFFCSRSRAHNLVAEQVSNIRATITRTLGISPGPVVPVAPHDVPKSSIGKILRPLLLNRLANGAFDRLLEEYSTPPESTTAPLTQVEEKIMDIWARAFDKPSPGLNDNFFDATDGESMDILWRELGEIYSALAEASASSLPPLQAQYADFVEFQRRQLEQGDLRQQLEYWREQLSGIQALELSADYPRPSVSTSQGGRIERSLPAELSAKLKAVAGEHRVTLFIFLLAAFQVLLFRHSGTADVAVGVPITNRVRREWQSLIGLFVNTLVMRSRLRGEECFSELLMRTGQMAINAYSHADLPFEKLVEEFAPQRDTSSNPLFQGMLSFQHRAPALSGFTGLDIEEMGVDNGAAKFDLALNIRDRGPDLQLSLIYRSDLFESGSMKRLLRHFEVLLRSIAVNPDTRVDALEILPDAERNQLLVGWNPAPGKPFAPQCVHDLFEQWAMQTPDTVALRTVDGNLGYRDLGDRVHALALQLQQRGVAPGAAVGLCLERSPQMIIGLLAILKAGGTYVPLDPNFPQERLQFIVREAALKIVITSVSSPLLDRLSCDILNMDDLSQHEILNFS